MSDRPQTTVAGIDTGGTFTDAVIISGGELKLEKVRSQPSDPSQAVCASIAPHLETFRDVLIRHGSTVATNALLELKGAKTALVTNRGFEDLIEIGRQDRLQLWDLTPNRPIPLVARNLRLGIDDRTEVDGRRTARATKTELEWLAGRLARRRVDAVAIGLLHSYRNPAAERAVARFLKPLGVPLSLSALRTTR